MNPVPSYDEIAEPAVSIILVNFRGADDTITALNAIRTIDKPVGGLEVIVVDNASGDDGAARIREAAPEAIVVESPENTGFAGGCNLGVAQSTAPIVAFLNNDARPGRQWVTAAVTAFEDPGVAGVASRVLDWDGSLVDFVGAGLTWFGMGYKPFTGEPEPRDSLQAHDVLFGTGSALFVRRADFISIGGFDERYFMFFEDVDLGWRLNLLGRRIRYIPESVAYHRHHASMGSYGSFREDYLLERNALFTLYKNLDDADLADALPAAMSLAVSRSVAKGNVDSAELDLRRAVDENPRQEIPRVVLAGVYAIDQFVRHLPALAESRRTVQEGRTVSDRELWPLFGRTDVAGYDDEGYLELYDDIVETFPVVDAPPSSNVLIITGDPIGQKMAGPAIRAWNMALSLVGVVPVRLISLSDVEDGFDAGVDTAYVRPGDEQEMAVHERWADIIVFQGHAMAVFDVIKRSDRMMIVDIYDPMHLEQLEQGRSAGEPDWTRAVADATDIINEQLERGDHFLAASERQRTFWLGQLAGRGRINPLNYRDDPYLRDLIAVVPFGIPVDDPRHQRAALRGVVPGIGGDSRILIWGGGLYDWFDPLLLIRAVHSVSERHPEIRLYFQGTQHPHPGVPEMPIVRRSRELSADLGLLDRVVFFNDSWVDYADRQNYLLESDAAVSTHHGHIETSFSFRTRILDYLWAELPMVVTRGDHFGDLVQARGLGVAVPPGDLTALVEGIEKVLFDETFRASARAAIHDTRESYRWPVVLRPFVAMVLSRRPAEDRVGSGLTRRAIARSARRRRTGVLHDLGLVVFYLRRGGVRSVTERVRRRLARRR